MANHHKKNNFVASMNPTLKFVSIIFLIVFIFLSESVLVETIVAATIVVLWFCSCPSAKATTIIIYSIIFTFCLLFLLNWIVVKNPSVAIFDASKLHWWGNHENYPRFDDTKYSYDISNVWGCKWFNFTDGDQFYHTESYADASKHFKQLLSETPGNWKFALYEVGGKGNRIWMCVAVQPQWYALSENVIFHTGNVTFKIISMIIVVTILVTTTTNTELTYAIYNLLYPLKLFKAPVKEWATILSLSIRFVPSLVEESKRILNAQASRGVDFSNGNFLDKGKAFSSLIIPMFVIAFNKSNDLAIAMEARNFFPQGETTKYRNYHFQKSDFVYLSSVAVAFGLLIMLINQKIILGIFASSDLQLIFGGY